MYLLMSKFLVWIIIFGNFFVVHFFLCFKIPNNKITNVLTYDNSKKQRINSKHNTFLYKNDTLNKLLNRKKNKHTLFYRSKKEKDIQESGYLYPFDHLEKKKTKFPPDPYIPSEDEKESSIDIFHDKINDDDLMIYEDDDDAKKYFGKTTFNKPNIIQKDENSEDDQDDDLNDQNDDPINNPTNNLTDNPTNNSTDNPTNNSIDNPTNNSIDNPTNNSIDNPTNNSIDNPTNNSIDNPTNNSTDNPINSPNYQQVTQSNIILEEENNTNKTDIEKDIININFYSSEEKKIACEMIKDQIYYLLHSSMDKTFIETFNINIESHIVPSEKRICVSYNMKSHTFKRSISNLSDLIEFSNKLKYVLDERIHKLYYEDKNNENAYLNKTLRKELEIGKKERDVTNLSKKNLQMSIESSLKLIEKCMQNMYKQNYEITLHDLKLAYNMLPCKYYGFFLSNLCSTISTLSYYVNDLQGTFNFALKSIKYEPKYNVAWKCLGDAYRSFRKFWQAKNFYDIAIYLGYKDEKGERFEDIVQELNNLTENALKNVDLLKEHMNNSTNIIIKKNIGIVLNKNPDSIGGCYVSYIIEGSKASKKNLHHGDQIVALNNHVTYGKPIDFCLKAFQKNDGTYDIIFFKGNIIELYGLKAYKYLMKNDLFYALFENEQIVSFKRNETILFDMKGFGTFSEYGMSKAEFV
ncbi:hypothetical protein PFHG_01078 [Plasmodium falciparum HB3]|uniref:PDZ domain-containing protein n=1 Tax=Plasmodium falciparum (isolate HB3) TaxID=137071 RepID=A0A0L7K8C5_PLAFX|nr:hypothetical protein PFHG_01078 [Plasmodium falciparum HB3]